MLESRYAISQNNSNLVELSEQQLMDCSKGFGNRACGGGNIRNSIDYLTKNKTRPLLSETAYPYLALSDIGDAGSAPCREVRFSPRDPEHALPANSLLKGWKPVTTEAQVEDALSSRGPVSAAIDANMTIFQHYKSGIIQGACGNSLDHGVLVVGFGSLDSDFKSRENSGNTAYWRVKNSWGVGWGDAGYFLLERGGHASSGECGVLMQATEAILDVPECTNSEFCSGKKSASAVKTKDGFCTCHGCPDGSAGTQCELECVVDADCATPKRPFCQTSTGTCAVSPELPFGCSRVSVSSTSASSTALSSVSSGVSCGGWACTNENQTNFIQNVFHGLGEIPGVANLSYKCSQGWANEAALYKGLAAMPALEVLSLDLSFNPRMDPTGIAEAVLPGIPSLNKLSVDLTMNNMSDAQAIRFSTALGSHGSHLRNLSLNLRLNDHSDGTGFLTAAAGKALGQAAAQLVNLEALLVSFEECINLNATGVSEFSKALATDTAATSLKELRLNFDAATVLSSTEDADVMFGLVGRMVAAHARNLEVISLDLGDAQQSIVGVRGLANGMGCLSGKPGFHVENFVDGTDGLQNTGLLYDQAKLCFRAGPSYSSQLGTHCLVCNTTAY